MSTTVRRQQGSPPLSLIWHIDVPAHPDADRGAFPARVSVPLSRGAAAGMPVFSVTGPSGDIAAAQARTIVPWSDGSPRWVQIDFLAASPGPHVVMLVDTPVTPQPVDSSNLLAVEHDGAVASVTHGSLALDLHPHNAQSMFDLSWGGRSLLGDTGGVVFAATDGDDNTCLIATDSVRDFAVEAAGPVRFQASWRATHHSQDGAPLLEARFRIELLAGTVPAVALAYQFFHMLPGHDMLDVASMTATIAMPALGGDTNSDGKLDTGSIALLQQAYSPSWLRRVVRTQQRAAMRFDRTRQRPYVTDLSVLEDDSDYPYFLRGDNHTVSDAVVLCGSDVAVGFCQREFMSHRPKELRAEPGRVELDIWPRWAGPMRLPQGRSSRQTLCMKFLADPAQADGLLTTVGGCDAQPAHAWLDQQDASPHAGGTWDPPRMLQSGEPGAGVFAHVLQSGTKRWRTVSDMFDHGDCPDTGYMRTYAGGKDIFEATPPRPVYTFADADGPHDLFHPPHELPTVWTNNEYDVIYCLALEAVRARDAAAWRKMSAAARHQIEVDFVHYSDHPQHHRSTPAHTYDHVTGSATIASHQWTQGLYYYHCLIGDDDVPEVVRDICDYNLRFIEGDTAAMDIGFNRELGWALIALCFGHELLGDDTYLDAARRIVDRILEEAARTDFSREQAAKGKGVGLTLALLGTNFNVNTITLGLKHFHQITSDSDVAKLLIDWTALGMPNFNSRETGVKLSELWTETVGYVCELTGDDTWLADSLWQLSLFFRGFNAMGWIPPTNSSLTTKEYCRIYRGLAHYVSALSRAGMLEDAEQMVLGLNREG